MYVTTWPTKRVKVGSKEYEIPTGPGNKVPELALVTRFLNTQEGDRGGHERSVIIDVNEHSRKMVPENPTVEQARDWWAHPNESDIRTIDTPDQNIFNLTGIDGKGAKEANKQIAIMGGTPEQVERVRNTLATSFTVKELKKAAGTSIFISDLNHAAGEYHGKAYGGNYLIMLDRRAGIDPDTITHEMIHHLRAVDEDRKDPLLHGKRGYVGKDRDLEEAATVAESMARHKPYGFSGRSYYSMLPKPVTERAEDRGTFTVQEVQKHNGEIRPDDNKPLVLAGRKGKRGMANTKKGWPTSNIAHLKITPGKLEAIDQYYRVVGNDGKATEVQVYSPQGIQRNVKARKGEKIYEYRDGKKVRIR